MINFEILSQELLSQYKVDADFDLSEKLEIKFQDAIPFDFFNFYSSISSVYSSKIEGEQVDVDSYLKHKFLKVK